MPPSDRYPDTRDPHLDDERDAFEAEPSPTFDPDLRPELDLDLELDLGSGLDLDVDSEVAFAADLDLHAAVELDLDVAATPETYYDLPVVKAPPWMWYVPAYFYCGGLAGAAASLAGAAELTRTPLPLERPLRWISLVSEAAGAALLIADLGRPARFHHMMRVFRPTSPMNLGTWILSATGATSALGLGQVLRGRRAPVVISVASVVTGALLATYTGVLLGNTAIPIWHATRRRLPIWFAALSAASLGSMLELVAPENRTARVYAAVAKTAQLISARGVARAAEAAGVAAPLRQGTSGARWRGATWLGLASLAATLWPGASRTRRLVAGALGTAAVLLGRFAIAEAGRASAADPRATLAPHHRLTPEHPHVD